MESNKNKYKKKVNKEESLTNKLFVQYILGDIVFNIFFFICSVALTSMVYQKELVAGICLFIIFMWNFLVIRIFYMEFIKNGK